ALSRAGERTRTTGVDCEDIICRRYLYKETVRGGERSVALGAEIRPDRPAQAGRQRFAPDSPVEGDGFELSVPLRATAPRWAREIRFAVDSPLEQSGFELWVPPASDTPGSHKVRC